MVKIWSARDPIEAQLMINALTEEGIRAVVQGVELWLVRGSGAGAGAEPGVYVSECDAERAIALIRRLQSPVNPEVCQNCGYDLRTVTAPRCPECGTAIRLAQPWVCPACHERVEGQFSQCWKCGTAAPRREQRPDTR